jgi:hypothetical protein
VWRRRRTKSLHPRGNGWYVRQDSISPCVEKQIGDGDPIFLFFLKEGLLHRHNGYLHYPLDTCPRGILTFQPCTNGLSRFHPGDFHVCPRSIPQTRMPKTKLARMLGNCLCQWDHRHGGLVKPSCDITKSTLFQISLFSNASAAAIGITRRSFLLSLR